MLRGWMTTRLLTTAAGLPSLPWMIASAWDRFPSQPVSASIAHLRSLALSVSACIARGGRWVYSIMSSLSSCATFLLFEKRRTWPWRCCRIEEPSLIVRLSCRLSRRCRRLELLSRYKIPNNAYSVHRRLTAEGYGCRNTNIKLGKAQLLSSGSLQWRNVFFLSADRKKISSMCSCDRCLPSREWCEKCLLWI